MTNTQSLGTTLKNDLTNNLTVSIVSAVLAVPALFAFTALSDGTIGGFCLIFNIGVSIPYAYERYWPVTYSTGTAAIWTLSAALITAGVFIGVYQI